mmetsp:Transcript_18046/g.22212  ORF Transcript_18046/g.22212 Transcript_18046/m.22212 type:complete len:405 (-) Transcript_18046:966-2180(-)|eukprot:CAMPEP_0204823684 /NCGR_PEP_ID=MMETSP1346-20131115/1758_1 /ASSEMBLY_ACC=CAM_ASM_000771 /TAXON_ID=215587 /ORGANISM="Aplanochytrium stocchinoi, Strain GSBS06" /LENGTH=404 /DNA_ID=CAMNT_0051950435 /DNA_START=76 /DNA_END=1290 /DNA_ORIENTATION=+
MSDINTDKATGVQVEIQFKQFMYYDKNNQQQGPAVGAEMLYLYESGVISDSSYVWAESMPEWTPLHQVKDLSDYILSKSKSKSVSDIEVSKAVVSADSFLPNIDDHFEDENDAKETRNDQQIPKKKKKKKNRKNMKKWIYVSGLPEDVTEAELEKHFSKVGFLQEDALEMKKMIKIYRDPKTGKPKGDCSICYLQEPSVELAITILHDAPLRDSEPDRRLKVEAANFAKSEHAAQAQTQTTEDVKKEKKRKPKGDAWERAVKLRKLKQRQALSWNEEGLEDGGGLTIVVIKNLFKPENFSDSSFSAEIEDALGSECSKLGAISKITIFEKNPEGVAIVKYKSARGAEKCIEIMNGRWFDKRKLEAFFWDGRTDYRVKSTEEEEKKRIESFGDWLEAGGDERGCE